MGGVVIVDVAAGKVVVAERAGKAPVGEDVSDSDEPLPEQARLRNARRTKAGERSPRGRRFP